VTSVAFNADDRHVASGSEDRTVRIWDTTTGKTITTKEFPGAVGGVAFAPDRKLVASTVRYDGPVKGPQPYPLIWDPWTGAEFCAVRDETSRTAIAFSPDGHWVAAATTTFLETLFGGVPQVHTVERSPVAPAVAFDRLGGHQAPVMQVAFSPDGTRLASAGLDRAVKVWDLAAGKEAVALHDEGGVHSVCFSPDGLRLAAGGSDGSVKVWAPTGAASRALQRQGEVSCVAFSPDGMRLAAAPADAVVWDALGGRPLLRQVQGDRPWKYARLAWSPDGKSLGCGGAGEVWDAETGSVRFCLRGPGGEALRLTGGLGVCAVAFCTTGKAVAVANTAESGSELRLWEVPGGRHQQTWPVRDWVGGVAFSPDGARLAVASGGYGKHTGTVKVWARPGGEEAVRLEEAQSLSVWDVAFSPDGTRVAAALGDYVNRAPDPPTAGEVVVWDARTGAAIHWLRGFRARSCVFSIAFSPDGKRLASAAGVYLPPAQKPGGGRVWEFPGEVKVWDLTTGLEVCALEGADVYLGVAFSPDGRRLATAGKSHGDGALVVWDGTPLAETPAYQPMPDEP
jgi:WD40 repeat protein